MPTTSRAAAPGKAGATPSVTNRWACSGLTNGLLTLGGAIAVPRTVPQDGRAAGESPAFVRSSVERMKERSSGVITWLVFGPVASNGMTSCDEPPIRSTPVPRLPSRLANPGRAAGPM